MSISNAGHGMKARRGRATAALIVGLVLAAVAGAPANAAITDKVKKACKGDYERLCPHYKVGSNQLRACMEAKQNDITWNCVQALIDSGEVDKSRIPPNRR